jgi:hypothetical protein
MDNLAAHSQSTREKRSIQDEQQEPKGEEQEQQQQQQQTLRP